MPLVRMLALHGIQCFSLVPDIASFMRRMGFYATQEIVTVLSKVLSMSFVGLLKVTSVLWYRGSSSKVATPLRSRV